MNDRYLFRGKRVDNSEWVVGWVTAQFKKSHDGKLLTRIQSNTFGAGEHSVDTETVGQCTGLKDKNGKLIFEGDIFSYIDCDNCMQYLEVGFTDGYFCYIEDGNKDDNELYTALLLDPIVCGNVYDNPELLEVKE